MGTDDSPSFWLSIEPQFLVLARDKLGRVPLHYACAKGSLECLELLLDEEPTAVRIGDREGVTPLMAAIAAGQIECAEKCLAHGTLCSTVECTSSLLSSLLTLVGYECAPGAKITDLDHYQRNALHFAVRSANAKTLQWVIDKGSGDVNAQDKNGVTPAHLAISDRK